MLDKRSSKWRDLVTGKLLIKTDSFGLQMFLKNSATRLAASGTPEDVEKAVDEVYNFFVKYQRILGKEIDIISK
jgi:hypothetical protein